MSSTFKKALFLILINFDPVLKKISNLELPKKTVFCNNRTNVNSTMHHGGGDLVMCHAWKQPELNSGVKMSRMC